MLNVRGAVSGHYLGVVGLVGALDYLELFGASLFRGHAKLGGDLIGVDQPLRGRRPRAQGEYKRRGKG